MVRLLTVCALFLLAFTNVGCDHYPNSAKHPIAETYLPSPNAVGFDITTIHTNDGSSAWLASYAAKGKVAKFRIALGPGKQQDDKDLKDFPIAVAVGTGKFIAEPDSDASVLLADLQKALEAKRLPHKVQRSTALPFTYVNLGGNSSQAEGGGLKGSQPGNWTAMKLFFGDGAEESEVFLNINPIIGKAEFSIKDEEYGDQVLAQLAKVL